MKLSEVLKAYLEGGNVFRESEVKTSSIKKENVDPTVEQFKRELSKVFPGVKLDFEYLGSTGRKDVSGDIDLLVDANNLYKGEEPLLEKWGLNKNQYEALYQRFKSRAKTSSDKKLYLKAFMELIYEKAKDSIIASNKSTGSSEIHFAFPQYGPDNKKIPGLYVQIDVNFGVPEWMKFSYASKVVLGTNIKGLHRTQLIVAMFAAKGYIFKHDEGVINRETREVEAKTPDEAIKLLNKLYQFRLSKDNIDDYKAIMAEINKLGKLVKDKIFDTYLKILDSTRADIPDDLQAYWIANKNRLELKGKFLPDDSKLKEHI